MKKLFTLVAAALMACGVYAQQEEKVWNFSEWEAKDYTATETIDGLTVVATSEKGITVDENSKTINDVKYTQRLKFNGSGNETARHICFDVAGPCKISIGVISGSSSATDRFLNVAAGTFDGVIGTMPADGKTAMEQTVEYTGAEPTKIYVYSGNSGVNIYYVKVTSDGSVGIDGVTVGEPVDKDAPVYNLSGQRVSKDTKGILIQNGKKYVNK